MGYRMCYYVICDECLDTFEDETGHPLIKHDIIAANRAANQAGWLTVGVLHYCPECVRGKSENKRGFPE